MKGSCLREVNSRVEFGWFTPPVEEDASCAAIGKRAEGAQAAAKLLSDYFVAINALASFGTARAGTDAQSLVATVAAAVGANSPALKALGSIAQLLVSAATSGYRERQLEKDLPAVSGNIAAVTEALVTVVREDYAGQLLKSEEQKDSVRYRGFARGKSPETVLMLDAQWQADERALAARRASAASLIEALQALSKGFSDLAANTHQLKAKQVPALLAPYVTRMQTLIPQIQKAF